jgi:hypothetical protein
MAFSTMFLIVVEFAVILWLIYDGGMCAVCPQACSSPLPSLPLPLHPQTLDTPLSIAWGGMLCESSKNVSPNPSPFSCVAGVGVAMFVGLAVVLLQFPFLLVLFGVLMKLHMRQLSVADVRVKLVGEVCGEAAKRSYPVSPCFPAPACAQ